MLSKNVNCTYVTKRHLDAGSWVCPEGSVMTGWEHWTKRDFPVEFYSLSCCTGMPRNAQKCHSKPNVQVLLYSTPNIYQVSNKKTNLNIGNPLTKSSVFMDDPLYIYKNIMHIEIIQSTLL